MQKSIVLMGLFMYCCCCLTAGQFQDQKGQSECKPCPPGFYCINLTRGFMGVSTPLVCPEGFYCPSETQSGNPVPCPKGTYSDSLGLISAGDLFSSVLQ